MLTKDAQERLKGATAFVTRVGGMGGPAAQMLAMAGVGSLIVAHSGNLSSPDLNRQVLGSEDNLGQSRAAVFAERLRSLNRFVYVEALDHEPDEGEALSLARRSDVIVSCPPNFQERLLLNRAAVLAGIPLVDAAQWGMTGTLIVVRPRHTACLECLYPEPPPFEEIFPVIGAISCAIGALAALEAIKILAQVGEPLWGQLLTYDGFHGQSTQVKLQRRLGCFCSTPS